MKRKIRALIDFSREMNNNNIQAFSSSVAFFFFLSVFPMLMFFCSLIPYLPFTEEEFISMILKIMPDGIDPFVEGVIDNIYKSTGKMIPITAIVTLWTAGMGILGLTRGLNGILKLEERRNYFVLRGISTIYTVLLLAVIIISMVLVVFGRSIYDLIDLHYPILAEALNWLAFTRNIILVAVMTVVLDLAYAFLPAQRQRLILSLPGALIASVGWAAITWFYSVYIDVFNGFSAYGSLMAVIFLLFWFYAGFTLVMFGAYLNRIYRPVINVGVNSVKKYRRKKKAEKGARSKDLS